MDVLEKPGCLTSRIRDATAGKDNLLMFYGEYLAVRTVFIPDMAEILQKPAQE